MEVPASSSALAADSIDAQIAANKIAHDIVVAKNAANKRSKTSEATSEATPIAAETSLPDAISSSFYMPGQRLSLADIDTLLAYNDAAVTSVLKLRNDNDAPIRHPKSGQVMEAASDEWPHWDERQRRLACLISCCPELVELPATTIARPAPATDVNVQLQDVAQSFTTVQGDIKVLTEASAAATAQLLELKKAMAAPAKTTTFADVTGKQLTTIVQQAAKGRFSRLQFGERGSRIFKLGFSRFARRYYGNPGATRGGNARDGRTSRCGSSFHDGLRARLELDIR
eukprot:jgi/Mesvir1/24681/Mv21973-RA.1